MRSTRLRGTAFLGIAALTLSLPAASPLGASARPAAGAAAAAAAAADPAVVGRWSAPFNMGGVAIHATLLRTGGVLFFQYVEGDATQDHTSYVGTWNYATGAKRAAGFTYGRDVFCAGNNVLPDGRVFIGGGHDHTTGKKQDGVGAAETDTYAPVSRTWKPGPLLTEKRWYPTTIGLPRGKTLIFGGQAKIGATASTVDEYTPATNTVRRLPGSATKTVGSYPRMHVMANGMILKTGPQKMSSYFNPGTSSWSDVAPMNFGARARGSSILLPGGQKVLTVGGQLSGTQPPTGTAEIMDITAAQPKWRYTGSLNHPRLHANTVGLPNGKVLIVGGGTAHRYVGPVKIPEIYNPKTGKWTALAPQKASRIYHGTALLLPDGRVLSAGQDNGPLATYGEIFSPPYLFKGPRPRVTKAPKNLRYGQRFNIVTPNAASIRRVTLIKAGSVTHSVDSDQRSVVLNYRARRGVLSAKAPLRRQVALPGYYMLFAVNAKGVPSMAKWVHVG